MLIKLGRARSKKLCLKNLSKLTFPSYMIIISMILILSNFFETFFFDVGIRSQPGHNNGPTIKIYSLNNNSYIMPHNGLTDFFLGEGVLWIIVNKYLPTFILFGIILFVITRSSRIFVFISYRNITTPPAGWSWNSNSKKSC